MRVDIAPPGFREITITLETPLEVTTIVNALRDYAANHSSMTVHREEALAQARMIEDALKSQ